MGYCAMRDGCSECHDPTSTSEWVQPHVDVLLPPYAHAHGLPLGGCRADVRRQEQRNRPLSLPAQRVVTWAAAALRSGPAAHAPPRLDGGITL
jgi:hypothetical protein